MSLQGWPFSKRSRRLNAASGHRPRGHSVDPRRRLSIEPLDSRVVPSGSNPNQAIDTSLTPTQLAEALVGTGVSVSNVQFTGGAASTGSFDFSDPTVLGFDKGILLSSGSAADVVGPNASDWTSTDFGRPGDADLNTLSGFQTFDAAVLEFDFVPTANQVTFDYVFASDEYPEWVATPYNDVFAFFVNGTNYATVRQVAGDPASPFVPVAVNNINNSNPVLDPPPVPMRADLFAANYYNSAGASARDFELDGITHVLTFQAPVNPGVVNHMKLAIADASDGIYDSAVFLRAGSIVSNENPVADLSLSTQTGNTPLPVTAFVEGEDPNGLAITYTIDWGDGTISTGDLKQPTDSNEKTAQVDHTYTTPGNYIVTLTVSNGTLSGVSTEDIDVTGSGDTTPPVAPGVALTEDTGVSAADLITSVGSLTLSNLESGAQVEYSTDGGFTWNGNFIAAEGVNDVLVHQTDAAGNVSDATAFSFTLDTTLPATPGVALADDTGSSATDLITQVGTLNLSDLEAGASVEYSTDNGATWGAGFTAVEGVNTVLVRQTDVAGNVSDVANLSFILDTTAPKLNPTFSSALPILVNAVGITVSPNATDEVGIASQWGGVIDTATAGGKQVTCTATDLAGNTASVDVPYVVGYRAVNVLPLPGTTFKRKVSIPISFQLEDANGVLSDQAAASLLPNIRVGFEGQPGVSVTFNKKTHSFTAKVKTGTLPAGDYNVVIAVAIGGVDVTRVMIPIKLI